MIDAMILGILFFVYVCFNIFTCFFLIRITDKIIPWQVGTVSLYYLVLVTYVVNLLESMKPFRGFEITVEVLLLAIFNGAILFFWLESKQKELGQLETNL